MIEIKNNEFRSEIEDGIVLVDFYAQWCGPCRMISPVLEQLHEEYDGKVKFVKVDIDVNPETAKEYGVMSIPNLLIFKDGELADRLLGFKPKQTLQQWINNYL
ncbi:thioredoxin [Turicibacter sanguinis]|uniref:Thioredoxin n=2 Tax=Turicibacter sanguinis TaxID=154288 RepID=A0A9X5AN52_9FIRM|nr:MULTISPECIES: thioredoxin [Turicibacter]EFF64507.1 thioredoxin [Turicibacter sanguinis PC909]EGC91809.1 thioredoxin [Turicibacter sp. HGF1]MBP3902974.1 thioredoxin [Turicibacter sp.]MCU7190926.1 thioredoxin [Turicibacter sanguinis]MCU7195670.1 thioredoxin [Turicibacter sanguinis]